MSIGSSLPQQATLQAASAGPVLRARATTALDAPMDPSVVNAVATMSRRAQTMRQLGNLLLISPDGYRSFMAQVGDRVRQRSLLAPFGTDEKMRQLADECDDAGESGRMPSLYDGMAAAGCGPGLYASAGPSTADLFFEILDPMESVLSLEVEAAHR